jgi:hypothetical protein
MRLVEEYIRRQGMTARNYRAMLARLAREFPAESFLIVRYGDHQPQFGPRIIDPCSTRSRLRATCSTVALTARRPGVSTGC